MGFHENDRKERNLVTTLIHNYFNVHLVGEGIEIPDEFVCKLVDDDDNNGIVDAKETFKKWKNGDKVMYMNIKEALLFMRDIPRKNIFWMLYRRKQRKGASK